MSDGHMDTLFREAQQRQINAMHAMAEATERNAAALAMMEPPDLPRFEYRRQRGEEGNDFQPVAPGPEWDLANWHESPEFTSYLWRRLLPAQVG